MPSRLVAAAPICLQVKGSPYPRSYYKCSQPGCPAKKIIERDLKSGRISQAELKASLQLPGVAQPRRHLAVCSAPGHLGRLCCQGALLPAGPA